MTASLRDRRGPTLRAGPTLTTDCDPVPPRRDHVLVARISIPVGSWGRFLVAAVRWLNRIGMSKFCNRQSCSHPQRHPEPVRSDARSGFARHAEHTASTGASPTTPAATGTAPSARRRPAQWMEDRAEELLPVEYFHVVFTLPDTFNALALANKRVVYGVLFDAVSPDAAGGRRQPQAPGRADRLHRHPAHLGPEPRRCTRTSTASSPAAACRPTARQWVGCKPGFFLPVRVLSKVFRGKFIDLLKKARAQGKLRRRRKRRGVRPAARRVGEARLGGLRQAAVRRPRAGAQVPGPLHPPHRHLQPPAGGDGRPERSPSTTRTTPTATARAR